MKNFCFVVLLVWGSMLPSVAQSYRVYKPVSAQPSQQVEASARPIRWQLEGAGVLSTGEIHDVEGATLSKRLVGGRVSGGYRIFNDVWLGVEWEELKSSDQKTHFLSTIRRSQWLVHTKWILTPNTTSKIYLLAGIGQRVYKTKFTLQHHHLNDKSAVYVIGFGGEYRIYKELYLTGQYRLTYDQTAWKTFILHSKHVRSEIALGLNYQF